MTALDKSSVYDVLVEECGAADDQNVRIQFELNWPECSEFRFVGKLGFGGKVWTGHPPYVNCYREDETPERMLIIRRANSRLASLWGGQ